MKVYYSSYKSKQYGHSKCRGRFPPVYSSFIVGASMETSPLATQGPKPAPLLNAGVLWPEIRSIQCLGGCSIIFLAPENFHHKLHKGAGDWDGCVYVRILFVCAKKIVF